MIGIIGLLTCIGYGAFVVRSIYLYRYGKRVVPALMVIVRWMVVLSAILCVCLCFRSICIFIGWRVDHPDILMIFYCIFGEVVPQIMIIILFIRSQLTAKQLAKEHARPVEPDDDQR